MKLFGITPNRLVISQRENYCTDFFGNKFEIIEWSQHTALLDNLETMIVQRDAIYISANAYVDYRITLNDCLNTIGMTEDFFYLFDLLRYLTPNPLSFSQAGKYRSTKPRFDEYHDSFKVKILHKVSLNGFSFSVKDLQAHEQQMLYRQVNELKNDLEFELCEIDNWLTDDLNQLSNIISNLVDEPF